MKRHIIWAATIAALALPATASAKEFTDKTGRFGLGADTSLGGVGGLSARFQVAKNFGVQAIVGFTRVVFESDDGAGGVVETTDRGIAAVVRGDYAFAYTNRSSMSAIFGVDIFNANTSFESGGVSMDDSTTRFAFEAGLKVEHHFTDWFSVHGEVGLLFAIDGIGDDDGAALTSPNSDVGSAVADGTTVVFGVGDVFGNAGITFWFK